MNTKLILMGCAALAGIALLFGGITTIYVVSTYNTEAHIETLRKTDRTNLKCNYNPIACEFIDKFSLETGLNFKHAENNNKEHKILNFFVDGYDYDLNIVFEYDETLHFYRSTKQLKNNDIQRMKEIIDFTNCIFIRYSELTSKITVYLKQDKKLPDILSDKMYDCIIL